MNLAAITNKINAYERLMRLDKPIGILLLLWPTLWALMIAGNGKPEVSVLCIFLIGTVLMRSAGCVLNDIADRRFDGQVTRTKERPLARGEVSVKEAYVLASVLSAVAFVAVCFLNTLTISLSVMALFLAASYPYMKRWIVIPQAYLGIAFGFGVPMAFAALLNQVPLVAWVLLFANIAWSIAYDTAYAMVDREDDKTIGIYSSALFFGQYDVLAIMLCYAIMLGLLGYAGQLSNLGLPYYLGLLVVVGLISYQFFLLKARNSADCFKAFMHNNWIGLVIGLAILADYGLR